DSLFFNVHAGRITDQHWFSPLAIIAIGPLCIGAVILAGIGMVPQKDQPGMVSVLYVQFFSDLEYLDDFLDRQHGFYARHYRYVDQYFVDDCCNRMDLLGTSCCPYRMVFQSYIFWGLVNLRIHPSSLGIVLALAQSGECPGELAY